MKNKKGSTIVWAVMLIMVLMVIVGASLSFAYMSYNQSIKNRNKTQVELIANSAIKSLVSVIEDNEIEIPSNTEAKQIKSMKLVDNYTDDDNKSFGSISDIYIKRKTENGKIALAYLTANYADEKYTIYAYLVKSNNNWKCVQYDTDGNKNINITDSGSSDNTGGSTGGNTGGSTGGNTGDFVSGSSFIGSLKGNTSTERVLYGVKTMLGQYYNVDDDDNDYNYSSRLDTYDGKNNIKAFNLWYKKQCEFNENLNKYQWVNKVDLKGGKWVDIYINCYLKNQSISDYYLEENIVNEAKSKNSSINNVANLYVKPVFFNENSDYYLVATNEQSISPWNVGAFYMIYFEDHWYTNNTNQVFYNAYSSIDAIRNDINNNALIMVE